MFALSVFLACVFFFRKQSNGPHEGRRNSFGAFQGKRTCEWQSGAPPSFAVGFRSNTHTLPNWRLAPTPDIHDDALCKSKACAARMSSARDAKVISKLAQRTQRQCTGYYCGYTFKPQPVGRKFTQLAAQSLNYLGEKLKDKTAGQRWHRLTHRILIDQQHRCCRRTAPEEWNLAINYHEQDVTSAEFVRTYRSVVFNGAFWNVHSGLDTLKSTEGVFCLPTAPPKLG